MDNDKDPPSTADQHAAIRQAARVQAHYLRWLAEQLRRPPMIAVGYLPAAAEALEMLGQTE